MSTGVAYPTGEKPGTGLPTLWGMRCQREGQEVKTDVPSSGTPSAWVSKAKINPSSWLQRLPGLQEKWALGFFTHCLFANLFVWQFC